MSAMRAARPPRVVFSAHLPAPARALLAAYDVDEPPAGQLADLAHLAHLDRPALLARVRDADALIPLLTDASDAALLDAAPRLRVVANFAVGTNNVDLVEATRRGVAVTNTPDVLTESTADLAFGLLLAAARRFREGEQLVRSGAWRGWEPEQLLGVQLHGATLGIVGFGRIGQAVARRARGFAMRVLYASPRRAPIEVEQALAAEHVALDELLARADLISLHAPLTDGTRHLIDAPRLARMKPDAVLVNTSRGPLVDEVALADALARGRLGGVGLDVYEREPAVQAALLASERAVLLPHIGSATRSARDAMARLAAEGVLDVLEGRVPRHLVNPEVLAGRREEVERG
jgi:glyoxylate reductase